MACEAVERLLGGRKTLHLYQYCTMNVERGYDRNLM
jgi:hypothetical protein